MIYRRLIISGLALAAIACGSRGDPRPPLRLLPPEPPQLTVSQIGTDAVLRFELMSPTVMSTDDELVEIDRIEILRMDQRYPALTSQVLLLALDRERRERRDAAREAVMTAEEAALERERDAELAAAIAAAVAAGEVLPAPALETEAEEATEGDDPGEALTEEELALRRVPSTVRTAWREGEVFPGTVLEAAEDLEVAVDDLWTYLGMPTAIVDVERTPRLPDPVVVLEGSRIIAATRNYDQPVAPGTFRDFAEVVATIPMAEIHNYVDGGLVRFAIPLDDPNTDAIRTRHFFAVRAVTTRGRESDLGRIVTLAPMPVPTAPTGLGMEISAAGIRLTWVPPATDVLDQPLIADELEYTVYRRPVGAPGGPELLTTTPLEVPEFLDVTLAWNSSYVYEVRAARRIPDLTDESTAPLGAPIVITDQPASASSRSVVKESVGVATAERRIEDVFAPAGVFGLTGVRAGTRVTLRWDENLETDLRGYRVYRHTVPAPDLPGPAPGVVYPDAVPEPATEGEGGAEEEGSAEGEGETDETPQRPRRQLRNLLSDAGWEMLTPVPGTDNRYIDAIADPAQIWIYVVEAVDTSGNASLPATVTVTGEEGS